MVTRIITAAIITAIGGAFASSGFSEVSNLIQTVLNDPAGGMMSLIQSFVSIVKQQ